MRAGAHAFLRAASRLLSTHALFRYRNPWHWTLGIAACLLLAAAASAQPKPVRVLLVAGGHPHNIAFYSVFDGSGFDITVNPHPSSYSTDLKPAYDVLVLYDLFDVTSEADQANLHQFLESGKGLVVLHHALADNANWPWWFKQVVGGLYLMHPAGHLPASKYTPQAKMMLRMVGRHPVTSGIENFAVRDEAYSDVWISPDVKVLIETASPASMRPLAWIGPYKRSRVIYIEPGHGPEIFKNSQYRRLIRNAVNWAAGEPAP